MTAPPNSRSGFARRTFLQAMAAAGVSSALWPEQAVAEVPMQFDGSKFKLAAPEPNPKKGARSAWVSAAAHRISTCTSRAPSTPWAPRAACTTT